MADIKGYVVKVPLRHNGKDYKAGSEIGLSDSDAKQLLEAKAIEPIVSPKDAKK